MTTEEMLRRYYSPVEARELVGGLLVYLNKHFKDAELSEESLQAFGSTARSWIRNNAVCVRLEQWKTVALHTTAGDTGLDWAKKDEVS